MAHLLPGSFPASFWSQETVAGQFPSTDASVFGASTADWLWSSRSNSLPPVPPLKTRPAGQALSCARATRESHEPPSQVSLLSIPASAGYFVDGNLPLRTPPRSAPACLPRLRNDLLEHNSSGHGSAFQAFSIQDKDASWAGRVPLGAAHQDDPRIKGNALAAHALVPRSPSVPVAPPRSARTPRARQRRQPQGMMATRQESQSAYNSIDPRICGELETRLHKFIERCEEGPGGMYVLVERCHSCQAHHALTTRHNEDQYASLAKEVLAQIRYHAHTIVLDSAEMLCPLEARPQRLGNSIAHGQQIWHHASRVGAFEVYLLTPYEPVEQHGTVVQFPEIPYQKVPRGAGAGGAQCDQEDTEKKYWGAQRTIFNGLYTAALLFSKLSSKNWPTATQVVHRLYEAMPRGVVTVRVVSPHLQPMPSFTVEVLETQPRPPVRGLELPSEQMPREPVHMVAQGTQGCCQIRGVPLQTTLELRVYHSSMKLQSVEFVASRLQVAFSLGADLVYCLWVVEIPGALAIYASIPNLNPSMNHPGARPFEGQIEMENGQRISVKGRLQIPWEQFEAGEADSPEAFIKLRRFHVHGYHPSFLLPSMKAFTMRQLHEQELTEIARLAAPEIHLQVVLPGNHQAVSNVCLEVPGEDQTAKTDDEGFCWMVLRLGAHVVRLKHQDLTTEWVQQQVTVDSMSMALQVSLPLKFRVWKNPILVRGEAYCHELWLAMATAVKPAWWEPYTGTLQTDRGALQASNGTINVAGERTEVLDNRSTLQPLSDDPLAGIEPTAPFMRRVGPNDNNEDVDMMLHARAAPLGWILSQGPLLLGTTLRERTNSGASAQATARQSTTLLVRSVTACCGAGIGNIQMDVDRGVLRGSANCDGTWLGPGLASGKHEVNAMHPALAQARRYNVHFSRTGGRPELPLIFNSHVYVFIVGEPGGQRLVQATATSASVPAGAVALQGQVLDHFGQQLLQQDGPGTRVRAIRIGVDSESLPEDGKCPVSVLSILPEVPDHQWDPVKPSPLATTTCGLQHLLAQGPITIGKLHPIAIATHTPGSQFTLLIEDLPSIGDAIRHLAKALGGKPHEDGQTPPLALAEEGPQADVPLPERHLLVAGQRLVTMVRLDLNLLFGPLGIGVPGATVVLDGINRTSLLTTGSDGSCEVFASLGSHSVTVRHPLLQGSQGFEVELMDIRTVHTLKTRVCLLVFSMQSSPFGSWGKPASTSVWVCTQPSHAPQGAQPVSCTLKATVPSKYEDEDPTDYTFEISGGMFGSVDLTDLLARSPGAVSLSLECGTDDLLWYPDGDGCLISSIADWSALLDEPIRAGVLKAVITTKCCNFGTEDDAQVKLAAEEQQTVDGLRATLAVRCEVPRHELAIGMRGKLLSPQDELMPGMVLSAWRLVQLEVRTLTHCCRSILHGVRVETADIFGNTIYQTNGGGFSLNDSPKEICFSVGAGVRQLDFHHQMIISEHVSRNIDVRCSGQTHVETIVLNMALYVYVVKANSADRETLGRVWICSRALDVPNYALPAAGYLVLPGSEDEVRVPLSDDPQVPITIPEVQRREGSNPRCPLATAKLHIDTELHSLWCPEEPTPLSSAGKNCCFNMKHLLVLMGTVQAAVVVHIDTGVNIKLSVAELHNMGTLRSKVAQQLDKRIETMGLFDSEKNPIDDEMEVQASQEIWVYDVAPLNIRVVIPESAEGDETMYGLASASIKLDGVEVGKTDERGCLKVITRTGKHQIHAHHACFSDEGRLVDDVDVSLHQPNEQTILADVRVFVFASKADTEDEQDIADGEIGLAPGTVLVWICSCLGQVQGEAMELQGSVSGTTFEGTRLTKDLTTGITEFLLLSGQVAQAARGTSARCTLASLDLQASLPGYCWRPRDPPPLVERAEVMGGCEYLRLIACPTVLGYLDPAVQVQSALFESFWMPVMQGSNGAKMIRRLSLDCNLPEWRIELQRDGATVETGDRIQPGPAIKAVEVTMVKFYAMTSCCYTPFDGVCIKIGGVEKGTTDSKGEVSDIKLPVGEHEVVLHHAVLGVKGIATKRISLRSGVDRQSFTFLIDARLSVWATDPEPDDLDEEQADEQQAEDDDDPGIGTGMAYLSSCVWIGADQTHVPDEAVAVGGVIACATATSTVETVQLQTSQILPIALKLGARSTHAVAHSPCLLSNLQLECRRWGYVWSPKDPSPLSERACEIGGCEFLRISSCPVSLGTLRPATTVQCANGSLLVLPVDEYWSLPLLRKRIAQELGVPDSQSFQMELEKGGEISPKCLVQGATFLCAKQGESLEEARRLLEAERVAGTEASTLHLPAGYETTCVLDVLENQAINV